MVFSQWVLSGCPFVLKIYHFFEKCTHHPLTHLKSTIQSRQLHVLFTSSSFALLIFHSHSPQPLYLATPRLIIPIRNQPEAKDDPGNISNSTIKNNFSSLQEALHHDTNFPPTYQLANRPSTSFYITESNHDLKFNFAPRYNSILIDNCIIVSLRVTATPIWVCMGEAKISVFDEELKKTLFLYNNIIIMSSLIDGDLFCLPEESPSLWDCYCETIVRDLSKKSSMDTSASLLHTSPSRHTAHSRLHFRNRDYLLQITADRFLGGLTIDVCQLGGEGSICQSSQILEREAVHDLISAQFSVGSEAIFFIRGGRIFMALKLLLPVVPVRSRPYIDIYNRLIHKNIYRLHALLTRLRPPPARIAERLAALHEDLSLTKLMHTDADLDFAEERMQFRQSQAVLKQHRLQLRILLEGIITENGLERTVEGLFTTPQKEAASNWLKNNLAHLSETLRHRFKAIFQISLTGERKIEDFVFNTVEVELKDRMAKPIAEGGSSLVYLAKALLSFVSSQDFSAYRRPEYKIQRLLAVKVLRSGLEQRLREKLEHEKRVVERMHGSCCHFLPKYYGTRSQSELSHCLLMEYVSGEPLDHFARLHKHSLSIRTKFYLMFNLVLGMRFLINREIVHLDLKPANVVVSKQLIPKIMDFGQAYHRELCPKNYTPGFTFPYAAPEVYQQYEARLHAKRGREEKTLPDITYSQKQDVFAFGVIMHELFFSCPLFPFTQSKYRQVYSQGDIPGHLFLAAQRLSLFGEELIMTVLMFAIGRCMDPDPSRRPRFDWLGVLLKMLLRYFNGR